MFEVFEKDRTDWDKLDDETAKQHAKFEVYRLLGPSRTLVAAYRKSLGAAIDDESIRTSPGAWRTWFKDFRWRERAEAWDAGERKRQDEIRKTESDRILSEGFALRHKRIESLNKMARKLEGIIADDEKLWSAGLERKFNASIIREFRGLLDDIAEELGERVRKQELTGADGAPLNTVVILPSNERDTAKN